MPATPTIIPSSRSSAAALRAVAASAARAGRPRLATSPAISRAVGAASSPISGCTGAFSRRRTQRPTRPKLPERHRPRRSPRCARRRPTIAPSTSPTLSPPSSLYRLNDPGEWGDSSYATITGYLDSASGTSGGTATLHVSSTVFGSLALPTGTATAFLAAPGLPPSPTPASVNPASIPLTTSSSATYTVTFPTGVTSINLGSSGSPVHSRSGNGSPLAPLGNGFVNGYITTSGRQRSLRCESLPQRHRACRPTRSTRPSPGPTTRRSAPTTSRSPASPERCARRA